MVRPATNDGCARGAADGPCALSPGLYAHIPFCAVRCSYCDFHVAGYREAVAVRYVDTILREARAVAEEGFRPRTIFVGGGTPSSLPIREWARFLEGLAEIFGGEGLLEWTVEANPGTVDREKAEIARAAGVDRVSTGAQTFDPAGLAVLGRDHVPGAVATAHAVLRDAGFERLSLDLILGWPGQTPASIERDLAEVAAIGPGHVSLYHLSYERGTLLERRRSAGKVAPLPDDAALRLARAALGGLSRAGYTRYEVSNVCRPGQAALHNLATWRGGAYRGIGSGAASFDGARRWRNRPDVGAYLRSEGRPERVEVEEIGADTALDELLLLSLRLAEGLDLERFRATAGASAEEFLGPAIAELVASGLLVREDGRLRATDRGFEVLDAVIVRLWEERERWTKRTARDRRSTPRT